MKLLIKIYLDDMNPYDTLQILDILNRSISDSGTTKIHLMSNDLDFYFENCDFTTLNNISVSQMINYKLDELDWDIVLPVIRPCIFAAGFDNIIKKLYNFPDLDGVLLLNDYNKTYPVVGRKYYNTFGYLYNPAYNKKNYEEEFLDILKINNKVKFIDKKIIKTLKLLKSDDDKIYELRKKLNFGIWN